MIAGNVPNHLVIGARTGFLRAVREIAPLYQRVAMTVDANGASVDMVDLGSAPMPTNGKSGVTVQDMIERNLTVTPEDWDITVFITQNALDDDRTGTLDTRVRSAGANFNKHMNKLCFQALNGGDGSTYGLGYDGLSLFNNSHVDDGAAYQTVQDNVSALALSIDNYETAYVAHSNFRDDQGEIMGIVPDLLVVPPALKRTAAQIAENGMTYDTANNEINPYNGEVSYIVAPWMDSTAWVSVASNDPIKPVMLVMRKPPELQSAWFDPQAPDGGRYYFKFFSRYNVGYGDWRLAYMGNT